MTRPMPPVARRAIALLVIAALATGCASLFSDKQAQIPVVTNPPGAYVYVNGMVVGQTPTIAVLDSKQPGHIQIYLPGFRPVQLVRQKSIAGWFWVNILVWPGFLIDLATGAYEKYDDTGIAIGLVQDQGPPPNWYQQQPTYPQQPLPPSPAPVQPGQPAPPPPGY